MWAAEKLEERCGVASIVTQPGEDCVEAGLDERICGIGQVRGGNAPEFELNAAVQVEPGRNVGDRHQRVPFFESYTKARVPARPTPFHAGYLSAVGQG
jgi:hypothetical protein